VCVSSRALVFFFQGEDGIRDFHVTGVQTCALPICCTPCAVSWRPWSDRRPPDIPRWAGPAPGGPSGDGVPRSSGGSVLSGARPPPLCRGGRQNLIAAPACKEWWAILGLNQSPLPCQGSALPLS